MSQSLSVDASSALNPAHVADDLHHLRLIHLRLRRHVAEAPVVCCDTRSRGEKERLIGMMTRLVHRVREWRSLLRATCLGSMTARAVTIEQLLPGTVLRRRRRKRCEPLCDFGVVPRARGGECKCARQIRPSPPVSNSRISPPNAGRHLQSRTLQLPGHPRDDRRPVPRYKRAGPPPAARHVSPFQRGIRRGCPIVVRGRIVANRAAVHEPRSAPH